MIWGPEFGATALLTHIDEKCLIFKFNEMFCVEMKKERKLNCMLNGRTVLFSNVI